MRFWYRRLLTPSKDAYTLRVKSRAATFVAQVGRSAKETKMRDYITYFNGDWVPISKAKLDSLVKTRFEEVPAI